jgi:prepilin-type N-terminal cleavage/methylation domain-containing protein
MNSRGFTLIEVIIVIVMISLASVTVISFFDNQVTKSADPLQVMDDNFQVVKAVEIINADYRSRLDANASQDIGIYNSGDLSGVVSGLSGVTATGSYTNFSAPDSNRNVNEINATGSTMYIKITASKNSSRVVTILGN